MSDFTGLAAAVTGGASGIGSATARLLAERGANVAVIDVRPESVEGPLLGIRGDVTDRAALEAAMAEIVEHFGGLDVLVNNAGVGATGTVADNPDETWSRLWDVNVVGIARSTAAALPFLRRSRHAAVVNTSSVAATAGLPQRALYSATKGAVSALTRAMAADHLREGIRVNAVNPGTADTPWIANLLNQAHDPAAERAALEARQPHGRLVSPEEVAEAIVYLASPRAGSTTGVELAVDGGMQALRLRPEGS
jgi:2-keto-3-deoxy-L-fuconate dehydrogenase